MNSLAACITHADGATAPGTGGPIEGCSDGSDSAAFWKHLSESYQKHLFADDQPEAPATDPNAPFDEQAARKNLPPPPVSNPPWPYTVWNEGGTLAVLTGHLPADFRAPRMELDELTLPIDLPLGVPSRLIERRPDVRAAEAQLHAATAQVGVAIANLLPQITITGDIGSTAPLFAELFKSETGFWSIGANASQALFEGGTLIHRKRAADAALDQAGAQYRLAVPTAFQNVADVLHALDADAEALKAASRAEEAAQKSLGVAHRQLDLGSVSYLALVSAEAAYQQAGISLVQARANRYADTAALFQALGGSIDPAGAK